jgi:iron(III) transport system ATP-binding protein
VAVVEGHWGKSAELPLLNMYLGDRWEYLFRTVGDDL